MKSSFTKKMNKMVVIKSKTAMKLKFLKNCFAHFAMIAGKIHHLLHAVIFSAGIALSKAHK